MIYEIRQTMSYAYAQPVPFAQQVLHMVPVDRPGLNVFQADLSVEPRPAERVESFDFFGNRTSRIDIDSLHEDLILTATARVQVYAPMTLMPQLSPGWESVREAVAASRDLSSRSPVHHAFPSRKVPLSPEITDYARRSFPAGRPILEGAIELMGRMKADFLYEPGSTDTTTPPEIAFRQKSGVCQDFAHVMIAGLRGLGLPAAYVSGYLRTIPPRGRPRLQGADATHAWVEVWCGPQIGWRGLDPTNDILVAEDHITVAVGRDYADVAPVDGIIVSSGDHTLDVKVDVVPQDDGDLGL